MSLRALAWSAPPCLRPRFPAPGSSFSPFSGSRRRRSGSGGKGNPRRSHLRRGPDHPWPLWDRVSAGRLCRAPMRRRSPCYRHTMRRVWSFVSRPVRRNAAIQERRTTTPVPPVMPRCFQFPIHTSRQGHRVVRACSCIPAESQMRRDRSPDRS